MANDQRSTDIACVAYFLLGAKDEMWNSHTGREALAAFGRLHNLNVAKLELIDMGLAPGPKDK